MKRSSDVLISAGVLAMLMVALAAMDLRVRDRFGELLRGTSGADAGSLAERLREVGGAVFLAVWDQSVANAPLTVFVVAALILVVFMVRT